MDEVVEITVGAMHLMAKDMSSRLKMKQLNCIPIFVQVLYTFKKQWWLTSSSLCSCFIHPERM